MSEHLSAGQRGWLRTELERRRHELAQRLDAHREAVQRAAPVPAGREQDADAVPQREGERGLDRAISELESRELALVDEALRRLEGERYGLCVDCEEEIPFGRLEAEPWALRCVRCQARREG